jgi:hypothetical protein
VNKISDVWEEFNTNNRDVIVYPNPLSNEEMLKISFKNNVEVVELKIFDLLGNTKFISNNFFNKEFNDINIDIHNLYNGTYFVWIRTKNNCEIIPFIIYK